MCDAVYNTKVHHHFPANSSLWREFMITVGGKSQSGKLWKSFLLALLHVHRVFYGIAVTVQVSDGIINQTFASQITLCFIQIKRQSLLLLLSVLLHQQNSNFPLHENYKISFNFLFASIFSTFSAFRANNKAKTTEGIIKIIKTFLRKSRAFHLGGMKIFGLLEILKIPFEQYLSHQKFRYFALHEKLFQAFRIKI